MLVEPALDGVALAVLLFGAVLFDDELRRERGRRERAWPVGSDLDWIEGVGASTNCLDRRPLFVLCSHSSLDGGAPMSADERPFRLEKRGTEG